MTNTEDKPINVSERYKTVLFLPQRTGSRSARAIFEFYQFTNKSIFTNKSRNFLYTHKCEIFPEYEDYSIISTARNPYGRVLSLFIHFYPSKNPSEISKERFKKFCMDELSEGGSWFEVVTNPRMRRKPDYILRLESLKDDYIKIPFIFDVLKETQLDKMLIHDKPIQDWTPYYDQEMKDKIYEVCKNHFEFWGYEK